MALSYVAYPADGVTTQYDITFGYLARAHVFVFVDDTLRSFRWIDGTRVELNLVPDPGQTVKIQRLTDRVTRVTDFSDGQTLLSDDLDASDLQNFYIVQELLDEIYDGVLTGTVPLRDPGSDYITAQWLQDQLESNQLTSQAFSQLLQRIIDEEIARAQAVADEAAARASDVADEANARAAEIASETLARANAVLALEAEDLALGQRLDILEQFGGGSTDPLIVARIVDLESVTVDLENDKAEASDVSVIQTDLNDPSTGLKVRATNVEDRVTAVETNKAEAAQVNLLDSAINDPTTGLDVRASSLEARTTLVEANKAEASDLTALDSRVGTAESQITAEALTRATDDAAIAQDVTDLDTRVGAAESNITSLDTAVAAETAARTTQVTSANSRIDDVESDVTSLTQTQANDNQARVDDITASNAATSAAQSDATSALSLVAAEESSRISEVSRLETKYNARANEESNVQNSRFQGDPLGYVGVPEDWIDWVIGNTCTTSARGEGGPGVVCKMDVPASQSIGIRQNVYGIMPTAKYAVTGKVRRRGGTFESTGILIEWWTAGFGSIVASEAIAFKDQESLEGQNGIVPDGTVTYTKTIEAPGGAGDAIIYAMGSYAVFGAQAAGVEVDWYECSMGPIRGPEAAALDAKATADNAVVLVASESSARASEIGAVQAQVDGNSANVTSLEDALVTGNSSLARLLLAVNTTDNAAIIEAFAGSGDGVWNGSKIKFGADLFEFDGEAVFNEGALSAAGTAVNFTVSPSAPTDPVDGEWWADSAGGSLYIRLAGAWQLISNISLDNRFRLEGVPVLLAEAPGSGGVAQTAAISVSTHNATGTVSYAWYPVGGDLSIACSNTNIENPSWSGVPGAGNTTTATWRLVATDSVTGDTATFDVIIRLTDIF